MEYESIVRQYVSLGTPSPRGWCQVLCKVCNDHGHKGLRAGFNFSEGIAYNCFNCEISFARSVVSTELPSDNMRRVFNAFGIPDDVISDIEMDVVKTRLDYPEFKKKVVAQATSNIAKTIQCPEYFTPLHTMDPDLPIVQLINLHLTEERAIDPKSYNFMVGVKNSDKMSHRWHNRLIIPITNNSGSLIFWQGRDVIGKSNRKYLSCDVPRDAVIYGLNEVHKRINSPLFIVEGFFDAFHLQGTAVLGRQLTPQMIEIYNSSTREKIVIPDRTGDGRELAMSAIRLGWKVSTPEFGQCKDVTEAVVKYGKLYVLKTIMDNIYSGITAETMIGLYCK